MRLINARTLELHTFSTSDVPAYAILSHVWEHDQELTYQTFLSRDPAARARKGFSKILKACQLADHFDIRYVWVDTCCIDKTSSAELTEAINSMFRWYRDATVCITWLADLPAASVDGDLFGQLAACRWFTRGWTLQELIAPGSVVFYDEDWEYRGTKADLSAILALITGIDEKILHNPAGLETMPAAQRMSWAANRQTTRVEDMAYCLLGIFDVNMPMLYGEGTRAFQRLQEEIARETNDLSLFAWRSKPEGQPFRGIFAESPADFRDSGSVRLISDPAFNPEYVLTNKGLNLSADLAPGAEGYFINLNCSAELDGLRHPIGVWIQPHGGGVYSRVRAHSFSIRPADATLKPQRVFITKKITPARSRILEGSQNQAITFRKNFNMRERTAYPDFGFEATLMHPPEEWDSQRRMFMTHGAPEFTAYGYFGQREGFDFKEELVGGESFLVVVGRTPGIQEPWVRIGAVRDGVELFQGFGDSKKMAEIALGRVQRCAVLCDGMLKESKIIVVSLEKSEEDGQVRYFVDMDCHEYSAELHAELKIRDLTT